MFRSNPINTYGCEETPQEIKKRHRMENIYMAIELFCFSLGMLCMFAILVCYVIFKTQ